MKPMTKKSKNERDDSLFGLLSLYKANNTYIKILVSDEEKKVAVFLTNNPGNWENIDMEKYSEYRMLRRLEVGVEKLFLKYICPVHIIKIIGPLLGIKIPADKVDTINNIDEMGYFIMEAPIKYKTKILMGIKKIINLNPHKKYEILEKCFAENQD